MILQTEDREILILWRKMVFYISSVTMVTTFNCNCNLKENYTKEIKMALYDTDFAMITSKRWNALLKILITLPEKFNDFSLSW